MKKVDSSVEMAAEYDMRGGVRGKYAARYAEGTNLVRLEADVFRAFPSEKAVNAALRKLIPQTSVEKQRRRA
jgi:hypothetical protein